MDGLVKQQWLIFDISGTKYIKCKDQPWLPIENDSLKNINPSSFPYTLSPSLSELKIDSIGAVYDAQSIVSGGMIKSKIWACLLSSPPDKSPSSIYPIIPSPSSNKPILPSPDILWAKEALFVSLPSKCISYLDNQPHLDLHQYYQVPNDKELSAQ